jgi:hypothetical protein
MSSRPTWPAGPGPGPDGLERAFRAADRRRLRTAAASATMPVTLAAVVLAAATGSGGVASLDVQPADRGASAPAGPGGPARARAGSPASAEPVGAVSREPDAGGDRAGAAGPGRGADASPPASPFPTMRWPSRQPAEELVLTAATTASTHVVLRTAVHPRHHEATTTGGRYAGVYFVSDDGAVAAGVARLPKPAWDPAGAGTADDSSLREIGDFSVLPAGGYTVYVFGDAETEVRVPVAGGERGLAATAATPANAVYRESLTTLGPTDTAATDRLPIEQDAGWAGVAGGWFGGATGQGNATFDGCLTRRGAACATGDPYDDASTTAQVGGTTGYHFDVARGFLAEPRDVLSRADFNAGTGAQMLTWYLLIQL